MNTSLISCEPVIHKDQPRLKLQFEYDSELNNQVRAIHGCLWSKTLRCWHIPDTPENREKFGAGTTCQENTFAAQTFKDAKKITTPSPSASTHGISRENRIALEQFVQRLGLKAYSPSTIKTYRNEFSIFLTALGKTPAESLPVARLKDYLHYCSKTLGLSENTIHSRMNALKFYYEQVLKREKFFYDIPRPKKPMQLPRLLNETELRKLFNALDNRKHKAMLFTAYSAGLRVSEIVNLKLSDIDSNRMQILVQRAKGKKDRYVNLSPLLLDILRQYLKVYLPRPKVYLFESEQTLLPYPARTVQQIFMNAKRKAGITKDVGIHSLRHSFATHLLDKGTDIRYIKELLGHFNIKTTERYLHVSKQQLVNIVSPLDDLWKKESIEW